MMVVMSLYTVVDPGNMCIVSRLVEAGCFLRR